MSDAAGSSKTLASNERARIFGEKCNAIYKNMVRRLKDKENPEAVLKWVEVIAGFAWTFHTGRYADGRVENPAFEIGRKLEGALPERGVEFSHSTALPVKKPARRRVLHVATALYSVGGHSRLISNWIQNDKSSEHSLALTNQKGVEIPQWMTRAVTESGGDLISLTAEASLLEKAGRLRGIAQAGFDVVVLHHHPSDVVPVVAFAVDECPPVALMNHADHVFGLGTSVADVTLNLRGFAGRISETRRLAKNNLLLPVPLSIPSTSITKAEARSRLGIPQEQIVLLSIGTSYKYTPMQTHDFFDTANKILTQNPSAQLYIIGISPDESPKYLKGVVPERLHFLGIVEDPALYRLSADLYLDSFPHGSLMALLETTAMGVYPVLMYAPPAPQFDLSEDIGFSGLVACARSKDEHIAAVNHLIEHPQVRREIGSRIRESMLSHHQGEKWEKYLDDVYEHLKASPHRPTTIPDAEFMQTSDDLATCDFNSVMYLGTSLLRQVADSSFNILTLKDMMSLFLISLSARDNKFSYRDARHWLLMFGSKLFRELGAKAGGGISPSLKVAG